MFYTASKEEINNIMGMPGEVSGRVLGKDKHFIIKKGGRKKIKEVENEIADFGHSFSYRKIDKDVFYPWGKRILSLLAIANAFKMERTKVFEIGRESAEMSFLKKSIVRYFKKTEDVLKEMCQGWRKDNTIGRVELKEFSDKEKKAVVTLYNLDFHPIFCDYFCGYLSKVVEISEASSAVCKEEICYFAGDCDFHQFVIKWQ